MWKSLDPSIFRRICMSALPTFELLPTALQCIYSRPSPQVPAKCEVGRIFVVLGGEGRITRCADSRLSQPYLPGHGAGSRAGTFRRSCKQFARLYHLAIVDCVRVDNPTTRKVDFPKIPLPVLTMQSGIFNYESFLDNQSTYMYVWPQFESKNQT